MHVWMGGWMHGWRFWMLSTDMLGRDILLGGSGGLSK